MMSKKIATAIQTLGKILCQIPPDRQELNRVATEKLKSGSEEKFEPGLSAEPMVIDNEAGPTAQTMLEPKEEGRQIIEKLCAMNSREMPSNRQIFELMNTQNLTSDLKEKFVPENETVLNAQFMMHMGFKEEAMQILEKSLPCKDEETSHILLHQLAQAYVQQAFNQEHPRNEYMKKAENLYIIILKKADTDLIMQHSTACSSLCSIYFHQKRYKECFQFAEEVLQGIDENYHHHTILDENNFESIRMEQAASALYFLPPDHVIAHCRNALSKKNSVLLRIDLEIIIVQAQINQGDKRTTRTAIQGLVNECVFEAQELGTVRTKEILNRIMDIQIEHNWHEDVSMPFKFASLIQESKLGRNPYPTMYPQESKLMITTALQSMVEYKQTNNMPKCYEQYRYAVQGLLSNHESAKYLSSCAKLLVQAPKIIQNDTKLRRMLFIVIQRYLWSNVREIVNENIAKIFNDFKIVITTFSDQLAHPVYFISLRDIFLNAEIQLQHEHLDMHKRAVRSALEIQDEEDMKTSADLLWKIIFIAENINANMLKEKAIHLLFLSITKRPILELMDCVKNQLDYFVKKQSLPPLNNAAKKYNYAVECYRENKFMSCAVALWEIISREKKDLFIQRRSITMMFHLILSKIDIIGNYLDISEKFTTVRKQYLIDKSMYRGRLSLDWSASSTLC